MTATPDRDPALLIVTADDYGLTPGVTRAILRAHRHGIVTSASLLAVGAAFEEAAAAARVEPRLGIGAHLAIVGEDAPLLSAGEIPTLVDRRGRFASGWRHLLARAVAGRVDPADVGRECDAQIAQLRSAGLTLDHVDTHQHVHLWPAIAAQVIALARRHGIPAVRVPVSRRRAPVGAGVRALATRLRRRARAAGLAVTDAYAGLDEAGRMDAHRLLGAIAAAGEAPGRAVEINVHPGERGDPELDRFAWGYDWGGELDALTSPRARAAVAAAGLRLGTYADLAAAGAPA